MTALILDGKSAAVAAKESLKQRIAQLEVTPNLVVVQVAGDPAADRYVRAIGRICVEVGAGYQLVALPADVSQAQLNQTVRALSDDGAVHGIIIQMPLPKGLDAEAVVSQLDPRKDIDGIHPENAGRLANGQPRFVPATPAGGMALLRHYGIAVAGKQAVVVGRSAVVGRPMAWLLLQADATVTIAHSRSHDLAAIVRTADIVVAAVGRAELIRGEMVKPGAVVIDFGINVRADGTLVGDVAFAEVVTRAAALTPVPGGTGPMTNVQLLANLVRAAAG
ncbi:MAG: bifunctional 5,10-methylenetetrahydrofolate dehydrogenase/5,10-methenyltetrahydrofolate cyclohydrolase [Chloroflexales bacterium]|nr:bifunctional 5,10-methylenetetrahydrofolate dehydrogenase/5,10-methenyltetrahydrofolate cyclohydrolase [Chloroflexales bacterium]